MKKVLIVDDSALVRKQLREMIDLLGFEIDVARNGKEAVEKSAAKQYDVITMDINMPVMDGLTAVKKIMKANPTPILMVSSLTSDSADITIEALELGAVDYIAKPGTMNIGKEENRADILQKVKSLSRTPPRRLKSAMRKPIRRERKKVQPAVNGLDSREIKKVLLVGASTGGPGLIEQICASLPPTYPHPVCIVQHMPAQFTAAFVTRLDRVSALPVHESVQNSEVLPGHVYVAKAVYTCTLLKKSLARLFFEKRAIRMGSFFSRVLMRCLRVPFRFLKGVSLWECS